MPSLPAYREDAASSARQGVLEFLLSQSMGKTTAKYRTKDEQTTEFIRTQCHKLVGGMLLGVDEDLCKQIDAFLEYLDSSVKMTPELYQATKIEEALAIMFSRKGITLPATLVKRARELYMRWSFDHWGGGERGGSRTTEDGDMTELVARTVAAEVTEADPHGAALVGALEDDFENAMRVKESRPRPADDAEMGGTDIAPSSPHISHLAQQAPVPQQRSDPPRTSRRGPSSTNPFYHPAMSLLEAAQYFHDGLLDARSTLRDILVGVPPSEVATMRLKKTNSFTRMAHHFICMNELLRFKREGWDLRNWPAEFGEEVWEPLIEVVQSLHLISGWHDCGFVGVVRREAKLAKDGIGWVMVWKAEMKQQI